MSGKIEGVVGDKSGPGAMTPKQIELKQQEMNARKQATNPNWMAAGRMMGSNEFATMDTKQKEELGATADDQKKALADLAGHWSNLVDVQKVEAGQLLTLDKTINDSSDTVKTNSDQIYANSKALEYSGYQQNLVKQGTQEQQLAYQGLQADIFKNTGVIQEYNKQLQNQQFVSDNVVAGMQAQQIAFRDQQTAIYQNRGALIAYGEELKSGNLEQMAFTEGSQAQEQAFYDTVIASQQAQGSYVKLNQQLGEGLIQNAAWNKGLAEGRLEIANQTLAIEEMKGGLEAYQEGIASGTVQQNAFNEGLFGMNRDIAESFVNLSKTQGALQEYNHQLGEGTVQYNAYHQAILDVQMANSKLIETGAGLIGTYQQMSSDMTNTVTAANKLSVAFLGGKVSALQWADSALAAGAAAQGTMRGLVDYAGVLAKDIPAGARFSVESLQEFVGVMKGIPSVVDSVVASMEQGGQSMVDNIAKGMQKGKGGLKDARKEIEDMLGIEMTNEMEDAFDVAGKQTMIADQLDAFGETMTVAFKNMDTEGITEWTGRMKKNLGDEFDSFNDVAQERLKPVMDNINELLSNPPDPSDEAAVKQWLADYHEQVTLLRSAASLSKTELDKLANIDVTAAIAGWKSYQSTLDGVAASFKDIKFDTAVQGLNDVNKAITGNSKDAAEGVVAMNNKPGGGLGLGGTKGQGSSIAAPIDDAVAPLVKGGTGTGGGAAGDTEQAAGAVDGMKKSLMDLMELFKGLANVANIAFTGIITQSTLAAQGILTVFTPAIVGLVTAFGTIPTAANTAFGAMLTIWGTIVTTMGTVFGLFITNFMTQLSTALTGFTATAGVMLTNWGTIVTTMGTVFDLFLANFGTQISTMSTIATNTFNTILTNWGATIQSMGKTVDLLGQLFQTTMTTMLGKAADVFGMMATMATTVSTQIGRDFVAAANAIIQAFIKLLNTSNTTFAAMKVGAQSAATVINNSIQTAANNALNAISQLGIKSASAFQTMANNATKVADSIKQIGTAASSAAGEVNALASAVNSVPTESYYYIPYQNSRNSATRRYFRTDWYEWCIYAKRRNKFHARWRFRKGSSR